MPAAGPSDARRGRSTRGGRDGASSANCASEGRRVQRPVGEPRPCSPASPSTSAGPTACQAFTSRSTTRPRCKRSAEVLDELPKQDPGRNRQRDVADRKHEEHRHEDQLRRHGRAAADLEVEAERSGVRGDSTSTDEARVRWDGSRAPSASRPSGKPARRRRRQSSRCARRCSRRARCSSMTRCSSGSSRTSVVSRPQKTSADHRLAPAREVPSYEGCSSPGSTPGVMHRRPGAKVRAVAERGGVRWRHVRQGGGTASAGCDRGGAGADVDSARRV